MVQRHRPRHIASPSRRTRNEGRYGLDLPLGSLSHGAQEQIVVPLRVGMACLVSGSERNLVVIADRLVNADPLRMKRLCLIRAEVAKSCQIVIATRSETP